MKTKLDQFSLDSMHKDPENWRGPFYFNRKDPRIIVPKFNSSMGWTFNCANILTYIIIAGFILIILTSKYLL
jgi:uncharacterized membrane protein